jgi:lipid II:glycine glycyltransferase (peptidoglycan interpeptide bridge formation enzyme)
LQPVHSIDEILLLHRRFPKAIRLFTAQVPAGPVLAGVVIFETATVAHAQYGAVSDEGRRIRALDALYMFLINYYRQSKRWFDFGISSEQDGRMLNPGLANQKEEFGGTGVAYDTYRMSVR